MSKKRIEVFGNVLVVDGEYYHCEDEATAVALSEMDGWHIEDHSEEIEAEAEMNASVSRVSYMDHFAASPQEEAECLSCLTDIFDAKTDAERDEVMAYYAKESYPALATMAFRALEGLRKVGDVERAAEVIHGLSEHLPEVFGVMQKVYKTA